MPDERLGVLVPGGEVFGAAVSGSLELLGGELGEPAFDERGAIRDGRAGDRVPIAPEFDRDFVDRA